MLGPYGEKIASQLHHIVPYLNLPESPASYVVCCEAMKSLGKENIAPDLCIKHCDEHVIPMLDYCVSFKLSAIHIWALEFQRSEDDDLEMLKYHDSYMRIQALRTFRPMMWRMDADVLTKYVDKIIAKLGDKEGFVRVEALRTLSTAVYHFNDSKHCTLVTGCDLESRLDEIIEKIDDDHWKVREELLRLLQEMDNDKVIRKYAQRIVPKLQDKYRCVREAAMVVTYNLEPRVLVGYVHEITPMLKEDSVQLKWNACRALRKLEPQVLARLETNVLAKVAEQVIADMKDSYVECRVEALRQLKELPLLALVPHRSALQFRSKTVASLRGRVWLVRWRQLFWGERLLWWWGSRAWAPGSSQAALLADQFGGCMQRRGQKRARS